MFQGRNSAVFLSILIHIVLIFAIVKTVKVSPPKTTKINTPIKSFLYKKPKIIKAIEPEAVVEAEKLEIIKVEEQQVIPPEPPSPESPKESVEANKPELQPVDPLDAIRPPPKLLMSDAAKAKSISQKALQQLYQLEDKINSTIAEDETFEKYRRRSPSVLDGEPYPVPHSAKALTEIEEKERNTTRYSDELSITKRDDGICTIEQDLSNVGIEGVKANSAFYCGESKFDASFREHMKKVRKKMGKK